MARDESRMAGGESRMTGYCCWVEGIQPSLYIDTYVHIHAYTYILLLETASPPWETIW